ncbi:MAG: hypothetical protein HYZ00_10050, partial [Candidatus Hydrogenedentes bacterium]|nr:hypothetical protein [Candidatus Hydrogenedentota bacterium]
MTEKHFRILAPLAILLAAGVAYVNTLDGDWVWDDASSVLLNEHVQQPGYFFQLFREDQHPFGKGAGNFYRPLVAASFMLDFVLAFDSEQDHPLAPHRPADVKPLVFHLTNLLWHAAAAVLLFFLLLRLDAPRWVAVAAPLLFVTHPLHTEAIAYISGRADMMSAAFMFAGLGLALSNARATRRRIDWGAGSLCFVAALLSKESSMIFPVLLALLIFLRPRPQPLAEPVKTYYLREATPLFAAAAILVVYALLRSTVLHFGELAEQTALPFGTRLLQTGQAFAFYLQKLFLPTRLHMEQTLAGVPTWTSAVGWAGLLLILAGLVGARRAGHHRIALGLAWFLAAWLPISGIFPLNAPMAEHWMYVPMAGFWWALCE